MDLEITEDAPRDPGVVEESAVEKKLKSLNLNSLTPIQALSVLEELQINAFQAVE